MTSSKIKNISTASTESNGSKIKGIIFDFDGVLSSFHARIGWPITSAAIRVKPDITREQIYDMALTALTMLSSIDEDSSKTFLLKFIKCVVVKSILQLYCHNLSIKIYAIWT